MKIPIIKRHPWLAAALIAAAVTGAFCWRAGKPVPETVTVPAAAPAAAKQPREDAAGPRTARGQMNDEWLRLLATCGKNPDPEELRQELAALKRRWLTEGDPAVTGDMCAQLLRSGDDAATGIPFEVGSTRTLTGWPTMRIFLLEVLATADPDLACEVGREILASTGSAEEYAVALKALTSKGPWRASDQELEGHFKTMLGKPEWQRSAGFAEGLDLARNLGTSDAITSLATWLQSSPPARELGQMAIHETAAENPQLVVKLMAEQPGLLEGDGSLRSSLLARAAISEQAQSGMVEDYLHNPAVPVEEKRQFLKLYPLRSASSGIRLYGTPPSPYQQSNVVQDDQAALQAVTRWKTDPALSDLLPEMNKLEGRLQTWVQQAADHADQ